MIGFLLKIRHLLSLLYRQLIIMRSLILQHIHCKPEIIYKSVDHGSSSFITIARDGKTSKISSEIRCIFHSKFDNLLLESNLCLKIDVKKKLEAISSKIESASTLKQLDTTPISKEKKGPERYANQIFRQINVEERHVCKITIDSGSAVNMVPAVEVTEKNLVGRLKNN